MIAQETFELRWIFAVVRRWWWLIAGCTALAGLAALVVVTQTPPLYTASATLLVEPSTDSKTSEYTALIAAERLALTYSEMLKGRSILQQVISELGLEITPEKLAKKISAQPIRDTQLIRLTVEDETAELAAQIANQLSETFAAEIRDRQSQSYAGRTGELQQAILTLGDEIAAHQAKIDELQAQAIAEENNLAQLQTSLVEIRNDTRTLQLDQQDTRLAMEQALDNVKVMQAAEEASKAPQLYKATVLLLIEQDMVTGISDYSSILASERLTQTYAQMLLSRNVLQAAASQLGITLSIDDILNKIKVVPIQDTQLIQLDVYDSNAGEAVALANSIAQVFVQQVQASLARPYAGRLETTTERLEQLAAAQESAQAQIDSVSAAKVQLEAEITRLESALAEDRSTRLARQQELEKLQQLAMDNADTIYVAEPASIPLAPGSNDLLYLGLAVIVGAMVGLGAAFLLEYLDDTIRNADDVTRLLGASTLGKIGLFTNGDGSLIVVKEPLSPLADAFRMLANNVRFATLDQPAHSLVVTSPSSGEGKSSVLANLAVTLARAEQHVIVVDADLRLPSLHKQFGIEQLDGLTGALLDGKVDGALKEVNVPGLKVLPSGKPPSNPTEAVGSARMRALLKKLEHQADYVLVDCPPVLPVADAPILASMTDGVILVLRANQTRSRTARDALVSLKQAGAKVVGVVLNGMPARSQGYYHYAYRDGGKAAAASGKALSRERLIALAQRLKMRILRR